MAKAILRKKESGEVWNVLGEKIICKVRGDETFGRFSVVKETSPPKGSVPPHFHKQTDEIIYVLDGEFEIECDGAKSVATNGSVIIIPRGTKHSIRNLKAKPGKFLAIITPSGFENFFAEVSNLRTVEMAKLVEIGKRNDLELVM
jgi:quercetin dioxygenase-like cupin family protein